MPAVKDLGGALRVLRKSRGFTQRGAATAAGISEAALNRAEKGKSYLATESLLRLLSAMGANFHDLHLAAAQADGLARPASGATRPDWVAAMLRHGIDQRVLVGLAITCRTPADFADLVASAESAAAEIVRGVIAETTAATERLSLVAEPGSPYGGGEKKR